MKQLFLDITSWQDETFPTATALSKAKHLQKEVKELIEDLESEAPKENREMEYADCFLLLLGSAKADGMNYENIISAISKKLEINKQRKWGKPDADGVVLHIKQSHE